MPDLLDRDARPNSLQVRVISAEHRHKQILEDGEWTCHCVACDWLRRNEAFQQKHDRSKALQDGRIAALKEFRIEASKDGFSVTDIALNAKAADKLIRLLKKYCPSST